MSVTCVPMYGLMFRKLTRFHALNFGALCIHRNSIVWRRDILARFPYLLEKLTRRILRYLYLLEMLISSEYGLTISGHVTVLRQWLLEKNTDYIIIHVIYFLWLDEYWNYWLLNFFRALSKCFAHAYYMQQDCWLKHTQTRCSVTCHMLSQTMWYHVRLSYIYMI